MLAGRRPAWMGRPYSLDLRKRVVAAIEGGMSRNRAAKQFGVAISTAIGWMRRVEETGSVAAGQMGGHKRKAISAEHAVWLAQRIRNRPSYMLSSKCDESVIEAAIWQMARLASRIGRTMFPGYER